MNQLTYNLHAVHQIKAFKLQFSEVSDIIRSTKSTNTSKSSPTSEAQVIGPWCPLVSVITTLCYVATIIFHRRVAHFLTILKLGYFCTKFRFIRGLHCSASPWRKIAYLIMQIFPTFSLLNPIKQ